MRGPSPANPRSVLLVASSGGHMEELWVLSHMMVAASTPRHWMTFDTPQTRELVGADPVSFIHPIGPRDIGGLLRSLGELTRTMLRVRPASVMSTGAAVAVPALCIGRLLGARVHYIESAARTKGPSMTGRLLERVPGVRLHAQWPDWSSATWAFSGSVFDAFTSVPRTPRPIRSLFVTLGTQRDYPFERLLRRVAAISDPSINVFVQHGSTPLPPGVEGAPSLSPSEVDRHMREADVVVAHAGVGTSLRALQNGRVPILAPREARHGEHVDNHQKEIADRLGRMGLAVSRPADRLSSADFAEAAGLSAVSNEPI